MKQPTGLPYQGLPWYRGTTTSTSNTTTWLKTSESPVNKLKLGERIGKAKSPK